MSHSSRTRSADSSTPPAKPPAGRPRDPSVVPRSISAVLDIYDEQGLQGLNFDAVARRSSVGKAALYARWSSIEDLLIESLETVYTPLADIDTGTVRADLEEFARRMWNDYAGPHGMVTVRVNLDSVKVPALSVSYQKFLSTYRRAGSAIINRGIERGEIDPSTSYLVILDMVIGSVMVHNLFIPAEKRTTGAEAEKVITDIVDSVLHGVERRDRSDPA